MELSETRFLLHVTSPSRTILLGQIRLYELRKQNLLPLLSTQKVQFAFIIFYRMKNKKANSAGKMTSV